MVNITSTTRHRRDGQSVQRTPFYKIGDPRRRRVLRPTRPAILQPVDGEAVPLPRGGSFGLGGSRRVPCEHWLYVMEAAPSGRVKVGSTHRPAARYRQLAEYIGRNGSALTCRALWSIGQLRRGEALQHEYAIHGELRRRLGIRNTRHQPEWYAAPLADVIGIVQSYITHLDELSIVGLA